MFELLVSTMRRLSDTPGRWAGNFIDLVDEFDELWDLDDPLLADDRLAVPPHR